MNLSRIYNATTFLKSRDFFSNLVSARSKTIIFHGTGAYEHHGNLKGEINTSGKVTVHGSVLTNGIIDNSGGAHISGNFNGILISTGDVHINGNVGAAAYIKTTGQIFVGGTIHENATIDGRIYLPDQGLLDAPNTITLQPDQYGYTNGPQQPNLLIT